DACEQAPLTPLVFGNIGREASAQGKTLGFERREGGRNRGGGDGKGATERGLRERSLPFQPAAHDFQESSILRPLLTGQRRGRNDGRLDRGQRPHRAKLRHALRRDEERRPGQGEPRDALLWRERREPIAP